MEHLLTIGQVAERSGLATSALRFYERQGLVSSTRTSGGQRRYRRDVLRRIAFIRVAQRVGIGLDEIAASLALLPAERAPTKAEWARLSRSWHARLDERIFLLEGLRDKLTGCIGCGCLSLRTCVLSNPDDWAASLGPGPRYLMGDTADTGPDPDGREGGI
jgi:MerR family redox-sensitive transcriptional activator SoxR